MTFGITETCHCSSCGNNLPMAHKKLMLCKHCNNVRKALLKPPNELKPKKGMSPPKKKKRALKPKSQKPPSVKQLRDCLDYWFSLYIRLRDTDENGYGNCCTCNRPLRIISDSLTLEGTNLIDTSAQCGHFMPRGKGNTRWHEKNCALQCGTPCNHKLMGAGKPFEFSLHIDKTWGEGKAFRLKEVSELQYKDDKYTLKNMINYFKTMAEYSLKEKNFEIKTKPIIKQVKTYIE